LAHFETDEHYKNFVDIIAFNRQNRWAELSREDRLEQQYRQLKNILALEAKFLAELKAHKNGLMIFEKFIRFICVEKNNILAARAFYRERQTFFAAKISNIFKTRDVKKLAASKFRINWAFIAFVLRNGKWSPNSELVKLSKQINEIRREILELNMPLALSQAKMFWHATPKSHLSYMDLIQIQAQALLLAIDKFLPMTTKGMSHEELLATYRKFRPVAIGIMMRDRLNAYSETLFHFYPKDKVKMYRANKVLRYFEGEIDHTRLSEHINQGLPKEGRTNPDEIAQLIASNSIGTVDSFVQANDERTSVVNPACLVDNTHRPDVELENTQAIATMKNALNMLSLREQKLFKMKGIEFNE
jgi:DNA-directed RNA polymerase specialized sigma subunit